MTRGDAGDEQRADDRVQRAAALADDVAHRLGEELGVEPGERRWSRTVNEQRDQRQQGEHEGAA